MAKLYITEFVDVQRLGDSGAMPFAALPQIVADQTPVAIGGGSLQSAAFGAATRYVRVHTDAICSIAYGANPTATINSFRMNANTTEYFGVNPGDKIAVISNT